jgi:hypothetical protein
MLTDQACGRQLISNEFLMWSTPVLVEIYSVIIENRCPSADIGHLDQPEFVWRRLPYAQEAIFDPEILITAVPATFRPQRSRHQVARSGRRNDFCATRF